MPTNNSNSAMSAKQMKRVPFDIELAKKIQSGEVEGRIVTSEDLLVRIVDFNLKDKTDSIVYIGTYANGEQEFIQTCDNEGKSFGVNVLDIELPEESIKLPNNISIEQLEKLKNYTQQLMDINQGVIDDLNSMVRELKEICKLPEQKHEFKPFDKVLVRDNEKNQWRPRFFDFFNGFYNTQDGEKWEYCIPFEGNEHLINTANKPEKVYE